MITKAIEFAAIAHNGQYRKGTNIPYIVHPMTVMYYLMDNCCCEKQLTAAILHDVLEDTISTSKEIEKEFGTEILEMVTYLTEPNKSKSWKERKEHTINVIKNEMPLNVLYVSCADKLHNLRCFHENYLKIGEKLWSNFAAPKEEQKWYYKSLADAFIHRAKGLDNKKLFEDFNEEVNVFFNSIVKFD
ncbi:MAG: HD domain-containing protein [bacterium]